MLARAHVLSLERSIGIEPGAPIEGADPALAGDGEAFALFARLATDLMTVHDAAGHILYASPASRRLFGWAPEELLGRRASELCHPADRASIARDSSADGERSVYRWRCADDTYRWVETRSRAYRTAEGARRAIALTRDHTEHRALELRLRTVIEEHRRDRERLEQLIAEDALTGLANRRAFEERLRLLCLEARRGLAGSLVMADLDHFKAYNDSHGHPAGDVLLRAVADILRRACRREIDVVARLGGEEFALVLPGTDIAGARAVAERAREAIAALPVGVSCSFGLAQFDAARHDSEHALLSEADRALYRAKQGGRNRVESL